MGDEKPREQAPTGANEEEVHEVSENIVQRSCFSWVTHEDELMGSTENDHLDTTTINEVAFIYGVPELVFEQYLAKEIHEAESCYGLPFTLLLVASYAGMMINHHDAITVYTVENALIEQIQEQARFGESNDIVGHKNLYDVSSRRDFYSWMMRGLLPLLFEEQKAAWELSEGYNDTFMENLQAWDKHNEWWNGTLTKPVELVTTTFPPGVYRNTYGIVSFYNRLLGGIRLGQERTADGSFTRCASDSSVSSNHYGRRCVGGLRYETDPDPFDGRRTADRAREQWLWQHDNETHSQNVIAQMELGNWIDDRTQKVEVVIGSYNGEHNLLTMITMNFFFNRAGGIHVRMIPESVFAEQYPADGTLYYFFDITWMTCLGLIVISESREVYQLYRRMGFGRKFVSDYFGFWNSVDWLSVVYGCTIIVLASVGTRKIYWLTETLGELSEYNPFWDERWVGDHTKKFRALCVDGIAQLEYCVFFMNRCRVLFSTYPLVIILRLMKAFSAQPRLAVVTKTLFQAGQDLIHFMVVFIAIYAAFVICAMILFGHHMDEFSTAPRAFISMFRLAMGDFNWESMHEAGTFEAGVFLVLFTVITVFMMLNILLAIIMSAYYEVTQDLAGSDTLIAEVGQAYTRWIGVRRGDMVPLMAIAHSVKVHKSQLRVLYDVNVSKAQDAKLQPFLNRDGQLRLVTVEFLKNSVMKMRTVQARELLENAVSWFHQENKSNTQIDQMLFLMTEMKDEIRSMKQELTSGPDSSSDSEADVKKAGMARTEGGNYESRHAFFTDSLEGAQVNLHHARLWIGQEDRGANARTKTISENVFWTPGQEPPEEIDDEMVESLEALEQENAETAADVRSMEALKMDILDRTASSLKDIDWLEPELLRVSEDTTEAGRKFYAMRQRVATLHEERHQVHDDARKQHKDVQSALMSRAECFELVHSLSNENEGLLHQLDHAAKDSVKARDFQKLSKAQLRRAQHQLEPQLSDAQRAHHRAVKTKQGSFSRMVSHMKDVLSTPFTEEVEGVTDLMKVLLDIEGLAYNALEDSSARVEHLGVAEDDVHDDDSFTLEANCDYDEDLDELVDPAYQEMLIDFGSTQIQI